MPKRSSKKPLDINELAASIVKDATEDEPTKAPPPAEEPPPEKNPAAVALGKLGGKKGGPARAKKLSPERRKEIAQKAAKARWGKKTTK